MAGGREGGGRQRPIREISTFESPTFDPDENNCMRAWHGTLAERWSIAPAASAARSRHYYRRIGEPRSDKNNLF
jgi:hypothetical protein